MFEQIFRQAAERWAGRLRNVRAELVSISTDLDPIAKRKDYPEEQADAVALARAVQGIAGILVRVLDALKGQN